MTFQENGWLSKRYKLDRLLYAPPAFEDLAASMLAQLEPLPDAWALDLGCGEGKDLPRLALERMRVVGIDTSWTQLGLAKERIRAEPSAKIMLICADATALPFSSAAFHMIFGKAILHHISPPETVIREVMRVLCPGGYVAFAEPLAFHPLFWLARRLTPQMRSKNERPFPPDEFGRLSAFFEKHEVEFWFLLTPMAYLLRIFPKGEPLFKRVYAWLGKLDKFLLNRIPQARRWAWYGVIRGRKNRLQNLGEAHDQPGRVPPDSPLSGGSGKRSGQSEGECAGVVSVDE